MSCYFGRKIGSQNTSDVSNVYPNCFFGKLRNHNWCKKTGLIFHGWCIDVALNSLIG